MGDDRVKKKKESTKLTKEKPLEPTLTETEKSTARLIQEIGPEVFKGMESVIKTLIRFKVEILLPIFKPHFKNNDAKTKSAIKTVILHILETSDD